MGYQGKFSGEQIDERLTNAGDIPSMKEDIATLLSNVGKPDVITDASDFATADHSKLYAYMGETTASYTHEHWYYYKNGAWTDGGVWGSAVAVDAELETEGAAADAKVTGGKIADLKSALNATSNLFRNDLSSQLVSGYITIGTIDIGGTVDFTIRNGVIYKTNKFSCKKGDVFVISGYLNANAPRLWGFTDSQQILLSKCENKVTLDNAYLVAPSDGYAVFTFLAESDFELFKMEVLTDSTFSVAGAPADSEAVGEAIETITSSIEALDQGKSNIALGYVSSDAISWTINGSSCALKIENNIIVRYDTTNASVAISPTDVLAAANESSLVTVSDSVISGTHYAIIFDFTTQTVIFSDTAVRATYKDCAILFWWHYGTITGLLVDAHNSIRLESIDSDVADIKAIITKTLPSYLETEAQNCKNMLVSSCDEKAFVVAFTTDNHYGASNGMNFPITIDTIKRVNSLFPVDIVINGGDLINGDETKTNAINRICDSIGMIEAIGKPAYTLLGNHDDDSFTASEQPLLSSAELYAMYWRHCGVRLDNTGNTKPYGYKDFDEYGLRLIFLDSMYGSSGHNNADWGYTDAELTWFAADALNTDKQVAIFSHMGFTKEFSAYNYQVHNGAQMRQAVESFIANGGICVAVFHGHTHWDFIGQYSQINGFHEVSTGCGRVQSGYPSGAYMPEGATAETRETGTVTQELWDIIVIKPESRTVNMIRYGAGSDRSFTY